MASPRRKRQKGNVAESTALRYALNAQHPHNKEEMMLGVKGWDSAINLFFFSFNFTYWPTKTWALASKMKYKKKKSEIDQGLIQENETVISFYFLARSVLDLLSSFRVPRAKSHNWGVAFFLFLVQAQRSAATVWRPKVWPGQQEKGNAARWLRVRVPFLFCLLMASVSVTPLRVLAIQWQREKTIGRELTHKCLCLNVWVRALAHRPMDTFFFLFI